MQYINYHDEENLDVILESDLLGSESSKDKFVVKVVKEHGTVGMTAVKCFTEEYFPNHWSDHFKPLLDLYWNENDDDVCLPKTKRLGSKYENLDLLNNKKCP